MPPNNTTPLYILLKYIVDQASQKRAQQAMQIFNQTQGNFPGAQAAQQSVHALNKELELLGKEILKIEDPAKQAAFTAKFEQMRNTIGTQFQQLAQQGPQAMQQAFEQAQQEIANTATEVRVLNAETRQTQRITQEMDAAGFKESFRYGITGFALTMTGHQIALMGQSLLSPIQKFTEFAGTTDPISRKWLGATKEIERSISRIGRVMASQLLPYMEKAAELAEKAAKFIEEHPKIAGAVGTVGAGAIALGGAIISIGQLLSGYAALKSVLSLTGGGAAAEAAVAGVGATTQAATGGILAALLTGIRGILSKMLGFLGKIVGFFGKLLATGPGAIIGGIIAGFGISDLISRTEMGKRAGTQPFSHVATVGAYYAGRFSGNEGWTGGNEERGLAWAKKVAEWFGIIEKSAGPAADELSRFGGAILQFSDVGEEAVQIYQQYQEEENKAAIEYARERTEAEKEYESDRADIVAQYGQDRAKLEADYERERSRIIADYNRERVQAEQDHARDLARATQDYQRDAAQAAEDWARDQARMFEDLQQKLADLQKNYNESVADAERDHFERLRKMREDHEFALEELVAARDALGIVREQRKYRREVREENREYQQRLRDLKENLEEQRRETLQDYQQRLQEQQQQYELERQRREEDFNLKIQEMNEDFAIEQQRRREDFEARLQQAEEQHQEELRQLAADFQEELRQLDQNHRRKMQEMQRDYEEERRQRSEALKREMQDLLQIQQGGYDQMVAATKSYVDNLIAESNRLQGTGVGSRATGGYVSRGLWNLHDNEYVLNEATTRGIEGVLGGRITQSGIMRALNASRRGVAGMVGNIRISSNITIDGTLGAREKAWVRKAAYQAGQQGVLDALGA